LRKAGTSVWQLSPPSHISPNADAAGRADELGKASAKLLTHDAVAYALGIYLLNLFLAFLSPKFDPSNDALEHDMEDGTVGTLPTKQDEEFKPFIRRLPEFKFWYWATRAITIGFVCTFFTIFDVPVFWPVLVMYWMILFVMTSKC
jgi:hypothetical protein